MKIYAIIAVITACFLFISCTNDDLNDQKKDTHFKVIQNDYDAKTSDSTSSETDPVKTNGKD